MSSGSRASVLFPPRIVDMLVKLDVNVDAFTYPAQDALEALANHWRDLFKRGKLNPKDETPLYNEFVSSFFITTLGYTQASGTASEFHTLRITKGKTGAQGIPDLSLGFFDDAAKSEKIIAVAEIKAWGKGLSNPVHSADHVLQTFRYLLNMDCDWGIATNIQEWRLYHRSGASKFQRWTLDELADDLDARKSFHACLARKHLIGREPGPVSPLNEYLLRVGAEQEAITKEFYKQYREIRAECLQLMRRWNPDIEAEILIEQTQKLLDRLLFICFAEDQDLLPDDILKQRLTDNLRMVEQPKLENLRELFRGIDQGWKISSVKSIPAYNGGLFQFDKMLDRDLVLTEQVADWALQLAKWDFYRQVGVDLLGHIFEQSITDLEQLRSEARGEEVKKKDSKRKREGVFYTPNYVTEYIVRQTVGVFVQRARTESLERVGLTTERLDAATTPQERELLRQHLLNWRDAIVRLRIVDPACGSGAFLLAAYKYLKDVLDSIAEALGHLMPESELALFVAEDHLLSRCLFGVDLNGESVEITKLSLWIETARKNEKLHLLDRNIYKGNSLIADHDVDARAFDWDKGFAEVMAEGGFDCVIGNPPYVRHERLVAYKDYLEVLYAECFDSAADLYTYFYVLGLRILKPGGRLGYISGGSFFRGGFGTPLRRYLREQSAVEQIINFGDFRVFPDAEMVDPSILILSKSAESKAIDPRTRVWVNHHKKALPEGGIADILDRSGFDVPEASLADAQWQLAPPAKRELAEKLFGRGAPLRDVAGPPMYGIKTGMNRTDGVKGEGVFLIDRVKRDQLVSEDSRSAEVLKPLLEGKDIQRWHLEPQDHWLIRIASGWTRSKQSEVRAQGSEKAWSTFQSNLPAVAKHLAQYESKASARSDQGEYWWELRSCDYYAAFEKPKIIWAEIVKTPRYNLDLLGYYSINKAYIVTKADYNLLGILNSKALWYATAASIQPLGQRAGMWRYQMIRQFVGLLPIPTPSPADERIIAACAEELSDLGARRYALIRDVRHRLYTDFVYPHAAMPGRSKKLDGWHALDFTTLRAELKSRSKRDIPLKERTDLEGWLAEEGRKVTDIAAQMSRLEDQMNDAVNRAFGLTEEECAIVNRVLDPVGSGADDEGDVEE